MRLKFLMQVNDGIRIDPDNRQFLLGCLVDGEDIIVLFVDTVKNSYYIEKVINKFAEFIFYSSNFERIPDDDKWNAYDAFFKSHGVAL